MSGDEEQGPYLRDKQGFRVAPKEAPDRAPYWWEVAVFLLFRWGWMLLILGLLMWWLSDRGD